jgi:hypothetical protein
MADETGKHRTQGSYGRPEGRAEQLETTVARGRGAGMPFALLGSVAFLVWGVLAILAVLVLLIWWLA